MELTGTIKVIGETQTFGNNGFRKRELVIETNEKYPQSIMVEFVQDKCAILDSYKEGEEVKIGINLRGREWINPEGKAVYFNSIQGWRISKVGSAIDDYQQKSAQPNSHPREQSPENDEEDNLPF